MEAMKALINVHSEIECLIETEEKMAANEIPLALIRRALDNNW